MPKHGAPVVLNVAGREVTVTNPGKPYFPEAGITKLEVVQYYLAVAGSFLLALIAWPIGGGAGVLADQGRLVGGLALLCALAMILAPAYRRWYRWMRRPGADEHDAVAAAVEREP